MCPMWSVGEGTNLKMRFILKIWCAIFYVFRPTGAPIWQMSMKFGKTKGTESLLKMTQFSAATLIFSDVRPEQYLEKQPIRQSAT